MRDLAELAVASIPCPYCGADPGQRCRTVSGAIATWEHSRRAKPIYEAWRLGYGEGLAFADEHPEAARRMLARRQEAS